MSWRFRKTFKVIPGVKLNLTSRGLSATIGSAPFSVNVGPRGVYRNISIPGTGIWDGERIDMPSSGPAPSSGTVPAPTSAPKMEVKSASTEQLTSEGLEPLRQLLAEAYTEREALKEQVAAATAKADRATRRYSRWDRGFIFKRLFRANFADLKVRADMAVAERDELQEQLRLTTIAAEINVDAEQAEPYYRMRDAFSALCDCRVIWNIVSEHAVDRVAERSSASKAVSRTPVPFALSDCDLIQWEQKVPHLAIARAATCISIPDSFSIERPNKPSPGSSLVT